MYEKRMGCIMQCNNTSLKQGDAFGSRDILHYEIIIWGKQDKYCKREHRISRQNVPQKTVYF